jgi:hypothetical protein
LQHQESTDQDQHRNPELDVAKDASHVQLSLTMSHGNGMIPGQRSSPARDAVAVMAAYLVSATVNLVVALLGMGIAVRAGDPMSVAAAIAVGMFFATPMVAGAVLGAIADRPAWLALFVVALALTMTRLTLGSAGLPRGWKIAEYAFQTALIAGTAQLVAFKRLGSSGKPARVE